MPMPQSVMMGEVQFVASQRNETYSRRIAETFHTMPHSTADSLKDGQRISCLKVNRMSTHTHRESTAEVIDDNPRTGIARVIHRLFGADNRK
jgi:hypothetical protein